MISFLKRVLIILFLLLKRDIYAQEIFSRINPSNAPIEGFSVGQVAMDHHHQIWFGGYNGLYRFDGKQISGYFSSSDTNSLRINVISDIYCDRYGTIWVSTGGYLHYYDKKKDVFRRIGPDTLVGYVLFSNEKTAFFIG